MRKPIKNILLNYPYDAAPSTTAYYFELAIKRHPDLKLFKTDAFDPDNIDLVLNIEQCDKLMKIDGKPSVYYEIDNHISKGFNQDWYWNVDIVFIAQKFYEKYYPPEKRVYLPLAADPTIHKLDETVKLDYDIGILGNLTYPRRASLVKALQKRYKVLTGTEKAGKPYVRALSRCKLLFNCSMKHDVNMRFFENMAIGRCSFSDYLPEQNELACPGVHYVAYQSQKELIEKVEKYLNNKNKAQEIAKTGRKLIIEKANYDNRLKQIITCVNNLAS